MTLSEMMSDYVAEYKAAQNQCAYEAAKLNFLDTIGCIMAGTVTSQFHLAKNYAEKYSGIKESSILGTDEMVYAGHAALVHSVAAHACDYDDMCVHLNGHPSAVVVPVVLALGERYNKKTEEILEAYMTGVEISSGFGRMFTEDNYQKAWNQTTALGIMGAIAAAGKLIGLSRDKLVNAFGIGIGESSGNKVNFGTMAKDLTVGMTAMKAILCAEFAEQGFISNRFAIEGNNGFFQTTGHSISSQPLIDFLENKNSAFVAPGLVIKPYPTCRGNHNVIDMILALIKAHSFEPGDIMEIICNVQDTVMDTERYPEPKSGAEGKFSIAYCIALCIIKGRLDIMDFQKKDIWEPLVLDVMSKVKINRDMGIQKARFGADIIVKTNQGESYCLSSYYAKGDPLNPMTAEEIKKKFTFNASVWMKSEKAKMLSDWLFDGDEWLNGWHILRTAKNAARGELSS